MNVESFKGSFTHVARPNLFRVSGFGLPDSLQFRCMAASIPQSTRGQIELPYMGRKIKLPGDATYADWTITVINTIDFDIKAAFETWHTQMNHEVLNTGLLPAALKRDGTFEQLDNLDRVIKTYEFRGAFPTEIAAIETNWETVDSFQDFTATLAYDYHTNT